jgi:peptidoglycan/LPS O-acetylase OafA/YrhL
MVPSICQPVGLVRAPPTTIPGLDGLRGLAASGIVVLHVWLYSGGRHDPDPIVSSVMHELRVGVTLFFVLSAFLLAGPWVRGAPPRARDFWVRRGARILPAFWLAVLAAFWVSRGTFVDPGAGKLGWFAIFAYDQVPDLVPLNPPLWSLAVEVGFYAVLPLLGLWLLRHGAPLVALALVAISLLWCWASVRLGFDERAIRSLPTFLGTFGCGIGAAWVAQRRPPGPRACLALLAGGSLLVLANGVWHAHGTGLTGSVVRDLPAAIGFALIVLAVAHRPAGLLQRAPFRRLGTLSYGVYVYHWPLLFWLRHTHRLPDNTLPALALLGALTLAVALLSYALIERPAVRLAQRLTKSQRRASASLADSMAASGNSSSVPQRVQIAS